MMLTDLGDPAAIERAWQLLKQPDTPDDLARMLCKYLICNCRDARRYTAQDILAVIEGDAHVI